MQLDVIFWGDGRLSLEKSHAVGLVASVRPFSNINQVRIQRGTIAAHEAQLSKNVVLLQISNT
jgi:hypothetical protein